MTTPSPSARFESLAPFLKDLLKPYRLMVVYTLIVLCLAACSALFSGYGLRLIIDKAQGGESSSQILWVLLGVVGGLAGASYGRLYCVAWITERIISDLRQKLFTHLLSLDVATFDLLSPGEVSACLITDISLIQIVMETALPLGVRNILIVLGGIFMLAWTSLFLTGVMLMVIPALLFPILFFGRRVRKLSTTVQKNLGQLNDKAEEAFADIRSVHVFSRQKELVQTFQEQAQGLVTAAMARTRVRAGLTVLVITLVFAAISCVFALGQKDIQAGALTPGQLAAFLFYALAVAAALGSFSEIYTNMQRAAGASDRFIRLLNHTASIQSGTQTLTLETKGALSFRHVSFYYPTRAEQWVFQNFNLDIQDGEKVAFVGPSGGGKSTLFALILRFYDPLMGKVCLDGQSVTHLDLKDYRSIFGLVPQFPLLIRGNILDNVRFGFDKVTDTQVKKFLEEVELCDFVYQLPQGFQTEVGVWGACLSGGQKQRIALARALLRSPRILLLDEATSALDAQSEYVLQNTLQKFFRHNTTLVIAHRFSTLKAMNRIVVLEKGQVVASGTHDELMEKSPLYNRLAQLQFHQST